LSIHQINGLYARVAAQQDVTKTLIAQWDTQINIEIAKAAKRDSELMKGITVVTMVFLPATFMATFFSMVFWHVGAEKKVHLLVNRWIWLYPAVTLPLMVTVLTWYWAFSWNWGHFLQDNLHPTAFKELHALFSWLGS
jgi:Mg2+ and Co2+ transporter CorA